MILQVHEAIETASGWVLGEPFDSPETIQKRMTISVTDGEVNAAETIRSALENEFNKWSSPGTIFNVTVVVDSGSDSIFSVSLIRETIYCKCSKIGD